MPESLSPLTTPIRFASSGTKFDAAEVGTTDDDLRSFLIFRLLEGEFVDTLELPETATAEDLREFLQATWKFTIKSDPDRTDRLNAMAPQIVDEFYLELFNGLKWRSRFVQAPDAGDGRHHDASAAPNARGAVATAADPVNLFDGLFYYSNVDLELEGAGTKFAFTRTYRQASNYNGPLGHNWDHNYNIWLRAGETRLHVAVSDGSHNLRHFRRHELHGYFVPPDGSFEIVEEIPEGFRLRSPQGLVIEFSPHAYLDNVFVAKKIVDRFGNYLSFFYSDGLLRRIEINLPGREVFFTYDEIDRIVAISDFAGRTWRYDYDPLGDLVAVTTPTTSEYKAGLSTLYEYSSSLQPATPHNLIAVIDPRGAIVLENTYGADPGLVNFNRVVRQREGAGETIFEYSDVIDDFTLPYRTHEGPAFETLVTERDGRQVRHLFNAQGNTVLRQEYARINGVPKIVSTHYRYNRDGNLIGILSPLGVLTQHLYGRDVYEKSLLADETYRYAADPDLAPQVRQGFNNLLATVRRGRYLNVNLAIASAGLWSADIFPDIFDTGSEDIIVKFVHGGAHGQLLSASDPRFTASADPDFAEAADYAAHLTTYTYSDPRSVLTSITAPAATLPDGTSLGAVVTTYDSYDERGRLLRMRGPDGVVVENEYYQASDGLRCGFLKKVVIDPGGLDIASGGERDQFGRIERVLRPHFYDALDGRYASRLTYNELDQVIENRSTPPFDVRERYGYDRAGNLRSSVTELKDEAHAITGRFEIRNCYDDESHLLRQALGDWTKGETRQAKATFDTAGRPRVEIQPSGYRTRFSFGERGLKTKVIRDFGASNATEKLMYDADGRLVKRVDALGYATTFEYDALGRLRQIRDPLGHRSVLHYDKAGNLLARLEYGNLAGGGFKLMRRTAFGYDELNRLVERGVNRFEEGPVVSAADIATAFLNQGPGDLLTTRYFYDLGNNLSKVIDASGRLHTSAYDKAGRQIAAVDPWGNERRFGYDKENLLLRGEHKEIVRDANGAAIAEHHFAETRQYDELNRLTARTDAIGSVYTYAYDSRSNLIERTGPLPRRSRNEYDAFNRLVLRHHWLEPQTPAPPAILKTRYRYDRGNRLDEITDPLGRITRFGYDTAGRPTTTTLPDASVDRRLYDRAGNVSSYTDRNGVRKIFVYDALHRNTGISVDTTAADPGLTLAGGREYRTEYDALSRTIALENDIARIELTHNSTDDVLGEDVTFKLAGAPGAALGIRRTFDVSGRQVSTEYPSGRTIEVDRDLLDRIVKVRQTKKGEAYPGSASAPEAHALADIGYEGLRLKTVARSNGVSSTYHHDRGGRVIGIDHRHDALPLIEMQWLYDAVGNVRRRAERTHEDDRLLFHSFDSLDRLTRTRAEALAQFVAPTPLGPSLTPLPAIIPAFQLEIDPLIEDSQSEASANYSYDAASNRLSTTIAGVTTSYAPNLIDQYEGMRYDRNGNLVSDADCTYTYDHANQLIRVENRSTGEIWESAYDALGRRCVTSGPNGEFYMIYDGGDLIEEYRAGTLVSSSVADPSGTGALSTAKDQRDIVHVRDLTGSTRCVLKDAEAPIFFHYDDFGRISNGALAEDGEFLFAGKRFISAANKYDFHARIYDPNLGRFIQRDPAGYVDGLNLYAYVGNNPVSFIDPLGAERQPLVLGRALGADMTSENLDFSDPNLGMDSISKFYFRDDGMLLRWSDNYQSWIEDYSGAMLVESEAPKPKGSYFERYMRGFKGVIMAPVELLKDTGAKLADMSTQGVAAFGQWSGWYEVGYTTWSSTSKAVEAGVPQSTLIWQATGGLVVDPLIAIGDMGVAIASGKMDLIEGAGALVGSGLLSLLPSVGAYWKQDGHHIHQSAAYARKGSGAKNNPNHNRAISIEQDVPGFDGPAHDNATAAQRNINRAAWGKSVRDVPGLEIEVYGGDGVLGVGKINKGKLKPRPSQYFEDTKAYYALRAAGIDADAALALVEKSLAQIESVGIQPLRVPTR